MGDEFASGVVVAFGRQLKASRTRADITREDFASRMGYSPATIAAFEQGRRIPPGKFIDKSDDVLGACGVLTALKEEVNNARYPAFFRNAAGLEAKARGLHFYATQAVPGLLQTEHYARAVLRMKKPVFSDETVEEHVAARIARQVVFDRTPPPVMTFVIEETVLRRPLGGRQVLRGQLEHMLLIGQKRYVDIQVMPTDREDHAGLDGPFVMIDTERGKRIVYAETQGSDSRLFTDSHRVHELESVYGSLRAQALTPRESLVFVETLLGER
nr:helix-turn-helix transcriptional regulator [Streptomyces aidingensis]